MRRLNWPLWSGLVLSVIAFISYFLFFARFPITRDIFLLFFAAIALLVAGVRRAERRKAIAWTAATIGFVIFVFFSAAILIGSRLLPGSAHAPTVGQKAPAFTLLDTNRQPVSLASLTASAPRGVLLVFDRGYW